jgi:TonB-linked SusC/RagA family outer membrane protein
LSFAITSVLWAQDRVITGNVTSQAEGDGLPGVNVLIQGTTQGTTTDVEGNYSLSVPSDAANLIFSFVGYRSQVVAIGNRSVIDLQMEEDVSALEEVVVTAFGLEREKKAVTYSAQNVDAENLTEARPLAIAEGLSGKVAGLSVSRTSGLGADPKVILRGNRSIAGSSQPIYVVDGVTLGGNINNISPDDIESITVLKGANAAALYGSRANNGVIVVTTKSGKSNAKGFNIDFNTSFMTQQVNHLINWQNEYGQGSGGVYAPNANRSWGPRLDGSSVQHWSNNPAWPEPTYPYAASPDNKKSDFFRTGHNMATNISVSNQGENTNSFISYTYTDANGVVPSNDLGGHNLNARVTSRFFDRLTVDTKLNYIRRELNGELFEGEGYQNPIRALYKVPPNIRTADMAQHEFVNPVGVTEMHYWLPGNNAPSNPYWVLNNVNRNDLEDRMIAMISLGFDITENLNFRVRSSIDRFNDSRVDRWNNGFYIVADNGRYGKREQRGHEWNTDAFLNYKKDFFDGNWSLDATVGANLRQNEFSRTNVGDTRDSPLNVPNLFAISNYGTVTASEDFTEREVQSVFGFATIGWKNAIFLDITARNDWSSTLPADEWSFFYPSFGLTAVVSDLVTLPDWWTFAKVRGSWAQVGNDTSPYQTVRAANVSGGGSGGFLQLSTTIPNANLRPEQTEAVEFGADLRFLNNRLGFDFTWYKSNSTDQLFQQSVPVGSGASNVFINGADIQNDGIEFTISATPVQTGDFSWDIFFNYAANKSEVIELAGGLDALNIGGASFLRQFRLIVGEEWGDVYSRGFARDDQGRVIVEADGTPRTTPGLDVQVANYNPDWLGGIGNTLTYKNLRMSFLIDIRQGGSIVSNTNAILFADGLTTETLEGRDGSLVFGDNFFAGETAVQDDGTPNTVATTSEAMWSKLGGRNAPVGEAFTLDASNTRLRELVIGYSIPSSSLSNTPFTHIDISLVGRNLFFFSNKAENADPEVLVNSNTNADGWEVFGLPPVREFGVNLKFGF